MSLFGGRDNSGEFNREIDKLRLEIDQLKKDNDKMDKALERLEQIYVRVEEFKPVKSIIYGAVGIILMAVCGALMATIGLQ